MVGRERERRRLRDAFEQAVGDRSCQLFTVLGLAGVGKSRLVQEFLDDLAGRALVARGRCLPYGEGITYWPLARGGQGGRRARRRRLARGGARDAARRPSVREPDAELVAQRVAETIGLVEVAGGVEERFAAVRALFEALARDAPAGRRLRRHPLGRGHVPRPRRAPRRLGARRSRSCSSASRARSCSSCGRAGEAAS